MGSIKGTFQEGYNCNETFDVYDILIMFKTSIFFKLSTKKLYMISTFLKRIQGKELIELGIFGDVLVFFSLR